MTKSNVSELMLPASVDLSSVHEVCSRIIAACTESDSLVLVASEVERIGTPGVQLLLAAAREISDRGGALLLKGPSEAVCTAFEDLGLSDDLKRWSDQ